MKKHEMMKNSIRDSVPEIWDEGNKTIHFGYTPRTSTTEDDEEVTQYEGYAIPLSGHMDYGHIKSQIVRFVYADKDVDALLNNALRVCIAPEGKDRTEKQNKHVAEFEELNEWRDIAGEAAAELIESIKTR